MKHIAHRVLRPRVLATLLSTGLLLAGGCRTGGGEGLDADLSALRDLPNTAAGRTAFPDAVIAAASSISAAELQSDIDDLASDRMNGRHWKSPEGWLAAGWIAGRLSSLGFEPAAADGTWYDALAGHPEASPTVIGRIPGRGPGIVLLTAHYDHLAPKTDAAEGEDAIYNGADDNASGVAGILAAARVLADLARRDPFEASIVLIAFSGEEAGLRGARDIVADPPFALDQVVGMINCDMISRGEGNLICIDGMGRSPRVAAAIDRANEVVGLRIRRDAHPDWLPRSDQGPFLTAGVQAVLMSVEDHEDYHQVTDHADRVDAVLASRTARLVALAASLLAREVDIDADVDAEADADADEPLNASAPAEA
jgi:hypothetical protein